MTEPYEHMLACLRDGRGFVHVNVQPPRDVAHKQCIAYLWEHAGSEQRGLSSPTSSVAVTPVQARVLLEAGAAWSAPEHLRAEVIPAS